MFNNKNKIITNINADMPINMVNFTLKGGAKIILNKKKIFGVYRESEDLTTVIYKQTAGTESVIHTVRGNIEEILEALE